MLVAETEPPQPLVVAAYLRQRLVVPLRVGRSQPFDPLGDRAAPRDSLLGGPGPSASRRVEAIHALHEPRVRFWVSLYEQPANLPRDEIG